MMLSSRILATISGLVKRKAKYISITARDLERRIPGKPSLAHLPDELIWHIVELVGDVSPESLCDLRMVCSCLYKKATAVRHNNVSLDFRKDAAGCTTRLDRISNSDCLSTVRTLRILGGDHPLPLIASYLHRMTGMREIHWTNAIIPAEVLEQIEHRSNIRLHVHIGPLILHYPHLHDASRTITLLESLVDCSNLVALSIDMEYIYAAQCLQIIGPLKRVLLSCPHIHDLDLDIYRPRTGCVRFDSLTEYVGFGFQDRERLAPLEDIRVFSYPFGNPKGGWFPYNYVGYPLSEPEEEYWAQNFDWSRLRRLQQIPPMLAKALASELTSLQEIDFTTEWLSFGYTLCDFLSDLPRAVKFIKLPSPLGRPEGTCSTTLVAHHGAALRSLSITSVETWSNIFQNSVPGVEELRTLRDGLPHLEYLALDWSRGGSGDDDGEASWPYDMLEVVATFPCLRRLELRFQLGNWNPVRPYLTAAAATQIASYLEQRVSERPLQRVRLLCGGPPYRESPDTFGFVDAPRWTENCAASFECEKPTMLANPDQHEEIRAPFRIRCERLDRVLNEKLWRIVRGEEQNAVLPKGLSTLTKLHFRVALQGPLNMDDYAAWMWPKKKK
ncbi:hypothetical protein BX600DRAFT_537991 [Xylariales sp. PMI_506]|nr:hypothetical protein BX600DRAFT_537991 [Xylariales sp. PMI_506]